MCSECERKYRKVPIFEDYNAGMSASASTSLDGEESTTSVAVPWVSVKIIEKVHEDKNAKQKNEM